MKSSRILIPLLILAGMLLYFFRFNAALIDDAYITLQFARNLAFHGTWGLLPGMTVNTATSPLNVIVLALAGLCFRNLPVAALVLTSLEALFILLILLSLSRKILGHPFAGWLAASGLIFNPLLNSTIGLESYLFITIFLAALHCLAHQRWKSLGLALGLLTLTRMEAVLAVPLFLAFAPDWRARRQIALFYLVPLLPWLAFSWICLGGLVPDTLLIKSHQGSWGGYLFANGPRLYYTEWRGATIWSLLFLAAAGLAARRWRRPALDVLAVSAGFAVVHYLAYSWLGVPPYHWYYMPQILGFTLAGAFGLGRLHQRWPDRPWCAPRVALTLLIPLYALYMLIVIGASEDWRITEMPIYTNWAKPYEYKIISDKISRLIPEQTAIQLEGEIGMLLFFSERRLLEFFSDRSRIMDQIEQARAQRGLGGLFARINFYWLRLPSPSPAPVYRLLCQPWTAYRGSPIQPPSHIWPIHNRNNRSGYILLTPISAMAGSPGKPQE